MSLTPSPVAQQPGYDTSKMGVLTAGRGGEIDLIAHNDIYLAGYSQDWLRKHNMSISSYRKYLHHAKDRLNRAIQDLRGAHGESNAMPSQSTDHGPELRAEMLQGFTRHKNRDP